ncbi:hypothetical protein MNBD_NITROSPINAE05-887 [hydrothermal vent metagenome]|uniref:DUF1318 domain-containing protein n=1 Tax=hydrothermal vent metagenome TaxID=652676 RepID=A0A3B1D796_9ZZZZ
MKLFSKTAGRQIVNFWVGLTAILWLSACGTLVGVDVTVVDQKTALENQILGSYEELGNDMLLLASVRSVDETGKLKTVAEIPSGKKRAIRAMQRQEFNRDDIQKFKQTGVAGEGNEGLLIFFENQKTKEDKQFNSFVQAIIKEENEDRLIILNRTIATNEAFSDGDLPKVQKIFASLNRDSAKNGEKIQQENGNWTVKKK